ncbi:aldose epimerase family protein [Microbulbifer sp. Q7]|uniref:aldose epimerase family protein n=1 Tax=Microbulbifer sp. Q7 TaxID=1785091 RepID=UPI000B2EE8BB|nr:aldose epimerase family protein [Microbulbifer sp. Q7]
MQHKASDGIGAVSVLGEGTDLEVTVIEFGARLASIRFRGREMLLAYPRIEDLASDPFALGAVCGRVANRIENARFSLDGREYQLTANDPPHSLHGGIRNFANQCWQQVHADAHSTRLNILSPDGDQGFPGTLRTEVHYQHNGHNTLDIHFTAKTDAPTPVDLTSHGYFTLGQSDTRRLELAINSRHYLPKTRANVPSGEITELTVSNTLDHRRSLAEHEARWNDADLKSHPGFDHYFPFHRTPLQPQATLWAPHSGVKMQLFTDQPGLQFYDGGGLGGRFAPYAGVCLEPHNFPNAINQPGFPSPVLTPDEEYQRSIRLVFNDLA